MKKQRELVDLCLEKNYGNSSKLLNDGRARHYDWHDDWHYDGRSESEHEEVAVIAVQMVTSRVSDKTRKHHWNDL